MKPFEQQIKDYREGVPSLSALSDATNKFFKEKYGIEGKGGKEKIGSFLIPGKIYTGEYATNSRISDKIRYINRYPLFIFLGEEEIKSGKILKSIDLNIIPPDYRGQILLRLFNQFYDKIKDNETNIPGDQIPIQLNGNVLSRLLEGTGYSFAVTGFKKENFRSIKTVDYLDWCKIAYLSDSFIQGLPLNSIYSEYRSKLKSK